MAKDFTLDDFRRQLEQFQRMDRKDHLLGSMPGMLEAVPKKEDRDLVFGRIRQMIDAMTDEERRNPDLIPPSCLSRIAASSGSQSKDVEAFLAQFHQVRTLMRSMG